MRLSIGTKPMWAAGMLTLLVLTAPAMAADDTKETTSPEQQAELTSKTAVPVAGMVAFIDPETGRITKSPTPEQLEAMRAMLADYALNNSHEGLYDEVMPNGTVKRHLQGRFQSVMTAHRAADGTVHVNCSQNHSHADHGGTEQPEKPSKAAAKNSNAAK